MAYYSLDKEDMDLKKECMMHKGSECPKDCPMMVEKSTTMQALDILKNLMLEEENMGKPLPKKAKRKDESEFQHKIRQWTEEVKDRPERFPGGQDQAIAIAAEQSGMAKALTTRNLVISQNDVLRSATTPTNRNYSKFYSPEGVAPLVGETFDHLQNEEEKRTRQQYGNCGTHGLTYKSVAGCPMCNSSKTTERTDLPPRYHIR